MTATATATAATAPVTAARATRAEAKMRALYEVNGAPLLSTLLGWTAGDRQAAEDLVQETMLRAWRNLDTLHDDPRSVRGWLVTVSRRLAIDSLRARAARPTEVGDETLVRVPVNTEPYEQVLDREVLRDALAGISAMHREVLLQVFILHQPVRQAAEALGVPEGTVKSRTHHALRALREVLGPTGAGDL